MRLYKVKFWEDNKYAVIEYNENTDGLYSDDTPVFIGNLSDCEAWIRLHKDGYMD